MDTKSYTEGTFHYGSAYCCIVVAVGHLVWFRYCPFTDWQWNVKRKSGEQNLPSNFIEYFIEKLTEHDFDSGLINTIIAVTFIVVCLISVYVNFILPRRKKN